MKSVVLGVFALFGIVFLATLSNAALTLEEINIPTTANPGSDVTISFSLNNTGTNNITGLDWSQSTSTKGTLQRPILDTINAGEVKQLSAIINIPRKESGSFTFTIKVSGGGEGDELSGTININNLPSLSLANTRALTANQSGIINVTNNGNTVLNLALSETSAFGVQLQPTSLNLNPGASGTVTVTLPSTDNLKIGNSVITIKAQDSGVGSVSATTSFTIQTPFCNAGEKGDLEITDFDINNKGDGDDDAWKLLDDIEIEVDVENTGDKNIRDVTVELGIFDESGDDVTNDFDFENTDEEKIDVGTLNDGEDETVKFIFRVPGDVEDGNYRVAIKVYEDSNEDEQCSDRLDGNNFEEVSIERESDEDKFIAFEDVVVSPLEATCGDTVTLTTDVFNIGEDDEDQVRVNLDSRELNLQQAFEIRNDMDPGDSETVSFDFVVPANAQNKDYNLELTADYDYRNGNYRESTSEVERARFRVIGCTPGTGDGGGGTSGGQRIALINAALESEQALPGEELVVKVTITNLKQQEETFDINVRGFESWATLDKISDRTITLDAGESEEITLTFTIDKDADAGQESFTIEVSDGQNIARRQATVDIEGVGGSRGITGSSIFGALGQNSYLVIIAIVNVILIILIIIVAVRVSRR